MGRIRRRGARDGRDGAPVVRAVGHRRGVAGDRPGRRPASDPPDLRGDRRRPARGVPHRRFGQARRRRGRRPLRPPRPPGPGRAARVPRPRARRGGHGSRRCVRRPPRPGRSRWTTHTGWWSSTSSMRSSASAATPMPGRRSTPRGGVARAAPRFRGARTSSSAPAPREQAGRGTSHQTRPGCGRRVRAPGERRDPTGRRAREARREHLRIARDEGAVAGGGPHDPDATNGERPLPAGHDRELGRLGELPIGRSGRRTQVADRVPALHEHEDASLVVAQPHVRRAARVAAASSAPRTPARSPPLRPNLRTSSWIARCPASAVSASGSRPADTSSRPAEDHEQRVATGRAEQRSRPTLLEDADRGLGDSDPPSEPAWVSLPSPARRPGLATESRASISWLTRAPRQPLSGSPASGHIAPMIDAALAGD